MKEVKFGFVGELWVMLEIFGSKEVGGGGVELFTTRGHEINQFVTVFCAPLNNISSRHQENLERGLGWSSSVL